MPDRLGRGHITRWADWYRTLSAAPRESLDAADLERLAVASFLIGDDDLSDATWEAAHRRHLADGDPAEASRCSFWLALGLMLRGQTAHAGGWLGRSRAVIDTDSDCSAAGYLLIPTMLGALDAGDTASARDAAIRAAEIAERFADADLAALATLGHGQTLLALGDIDAGTARLDEAMLQVSTGDVGPIASGIVYCAVILECMQIFDLARAAEWTDALNDWCEAQPDLVPYRGQCLVHRSQMQLARGEWSAAVTTVESARDRLTDPPHPALGLAHYQVAELHRLTGEFDAAEREFRRASRAGHEPMPGLALLELARGDTASAAAAIRRSLHETSRPVKRAGLLAAAVDIYLAANDASAARSAADELDEIARSSPSEVLRAIADHSLGVVSLVEGRPALALMHLRAAAELWQRLNMPYEMARTGVWLGSSCDALGDPTSASLEWDNARAAFDELGARHDLERLRSVARSLDTATDRAMRNDAVLSARELEVLTHAASGQTNREIAADLHISPHTVRRHMENIFTKLGVNGRAAATAYAYEHDLL